MVTLYSDCCGEPDRLFRRVLDMSHSDMGICPKCGEHCDFLNTELFLKINRATRGKKDLISVTIRQAIKDRASHIELFEYIKSQAKDNMRMMSEVLGIELTEKIMSL